MTVSRMRELLGPAWWLVSLLITLALLASFGSAVVQRQMIEVLIYVMLTVGLYVFAGNTGVLSFGHISFMAVGAYTTAIVSIPIVRKAILLPDLPNFLKSTEFTPIVATLVAGVAAALLAAVIVVPICRLSGLAGSLAMFAVLVVVYEVAVNWDSVTRGSKAMIGVPNNVSIGSALAWTVAVVIMAAIYQGTSAGLRVRATREDEYGAMAAGISVAKERIVPFLMSAFIIGLGGSLYAQMQGAFTPSSFYLKITFMTIAMLVVGGQKSLAGAVIGAAVISIAGFVFDNFESGFVVAGAHVSGRAGLGDALLAALILLILAVRRDGIMRGRELVGVRQLPSFLARARNVHKSSADHNRHVSDNEKG